MDTPLDDTEFDRALIAAAFEAIAANGWVRFSIAAAAREAGLPLERARLRMPGRVSLLRQFGRLADAAALAGADTDGPVRDRLFDMLMRRIDVLQAHRGGMLALLQALPADPLAAMVLGRGHMTSMGWMLAAAGLEAEGPLGMLRRKGLLAVWLWTVRAWQRDTSEDLSATMAALDTALGKAEQMANWIDGRRGSADASPAVAEETPPAP